MKVSGPGSGLPPAAAPEQEGLPSKEVAGPAGAEAPARPAPEGTAGVRGALTERAAGARGTSATPNAPSPVAQELAAALQTGKVGLHEATQQLIEHVLDKQVGAEAPAALREKLRSVLSESLESDPLLREKLKALGA